MQINNLSALKGSRSSSGNWLSVRGVNVGNQRWSSSRRTLFRMANMKNKNMWMVWWEQTPHMVGWRTQAIRTVSFCFSSFWEMLHADHRTDHRFLTSWSRPFETDLFPVLRDLAHAAGWDPFNLRDLTHVYFLGWICTKEILHDVSQRQVRN